MLQIVKLHPSLEQNHNCVHYSYPYAVELCPGCLLIMIYEDSYGAPSALGAATGPE